LDHSRYLLKTESDEVILDEVFSAIREIQSEAAKLHLLSTASQKSMLLSHLLQQTILKEIFSGGSIDKIIQSLEISFSEFPLDLNSPVFLMYTQIHNRTFQEQYRIHSRTTLEYLQLMDRLCVNKFHYSMLDLEQGTLLWLFQPSFDPSLASEFDLLESLANDFSDYCTDTLHRHVTVVLYPAASDWENIYKNFY